MATPVLMPKQGQSVEEATLVEWKKKTGETVKTGDVLCSIETDKATFDVESPADGILLAQFAQAGDLVPVLTNIAAVGSAGEDVASLKPQVGKAPSAEKTKAPEPARSEPTPMPTMKQGAAQAGISPRAKNAAERLGVDASTVQGSGPGGRVIARDVEALPRLTPVARATAKEEGLVPPPLAKGLVRSSLLVQRSSAARTAEAEDRVDVIPYKGIRKLIGDRLHASLAATAQLTMNVSADASALQRYRSLVKARGKEMGLPNITLGDMICFAVAQTLPAFPELNALFTGEAVERHSGVHLAVAVDTPRGLMVPVVRHAETYPLARLSETIADLAGQCRKGSVNPDLLSGGTITISNLGAMGVETFTPILNPPQVAILGVCGIQPKPVREGATVTFVDHVGLSLTVDHRVVDGAPAARFLQELARRLKEFELLLSL